MDGNDNQTGAPQTVYKYMSYDVAVDVISHQWFRISRISSLNDPFEWRMRLDSTESEEDECWILDRLVHAFDSRFGLLSFSSTAKSKLMWSHYANGHTGIVLEVEVPDLQEVRYGESVSVREVQHAIGNAPSSIVPDNALFFLRKGSVWSYEKEWRKVFDLSARPKQTTGVVRRREQYYKASVFGNKITILGQEKKGPPCYYWKFPKTALKAIRFGAKTPKENKSELIRLTERYKLDSIKLIQMKLSEKNQRLQELSML